MADLHIKKAGAWATIATAHMKKAGAWAEAASVYIKKAGAWVEVWANWVVSMPSASAFGTGASPPTVGIQTRTDGGIYRSTGGAYSQVDNWIDPQSEFDSPPTVHVRFTEFSTSGSWSYSSITPDGTTWYDVKAATRTVNGINTGSGSATAVVTVEISLDSGSTVHDTGTWSFESADLS